VGTDVSGEHRLTAFVDYTFGRKDGGSSFQTWAYEELLINPEIPMPLQQLLLIFLHFIALQ
jgi:hypothetical protein